MSDANLDASLAPGYRSMSLPVDWRCTLELVPIREWEPSYPTMAEHLASNRGRGRRLSLVVAMTLLSVLVSGCKAIS